VGRIKRYFRPFATLSPFYFRAHQIWLEIEPHEAYYRDMMMLNGIEYSQRAAALAYGEWNGLNDLAEELGL
jgi:hypothetical protein